VVWEWIVSGVAASAAAICAATICAVVAALSVLTITTVIDIAWEYLEGAERLVIVDYNITQALEDIVKKKSNSNAPVQKVVYDPQSRKAVVVAGQRADATLADAFIEVSIK
jgi:hypothetical protein